MNENTNRPAMLILVALVLGHFAASIGADIDTDDVVDGNGFRVSTVRRFIEVAEGKFAATRDQAHAAAIVWVKAGRPVSADALPAR